MSRPLILMELSPDQLLRMLNDLVDFDLGGRIRVYRLCTIYNERMKQ